MFESYQATFDKKVHRRVGYAGLRTGWAQYFAAWFVSTAIVAILAAIFMYLGTGMRTPHDENTLWTIALSFAFTFTTVGALELIRRWLDARGVGESFRYTFDDDALTLERENGIRYTIPRHLLKIKGETRDCLIVTECG